MKGQKFFWIKVFFLNGLIFISTIRSIPPSKANEASWGGDQSHGSPKSAGVRTDTPYCKHGTSFELLPRGENGDLLWKVLELEGEQAFRITVAEPYVDAPPILNEIVIVDSIGLKSYEFPDGNWDKRYRYTVQIICNPADPSHSIAASGMLFQDQLFSTNPTITIPEI